MDMQLLLKGPGCVSCMRMLLLVWSPVALLEAGSVHVWHAYTSPSDHNQGSHAFAGVPSAPAPLWPGPRMDNHIHCCPCSPGDLLFYSLHVTHGFSYMCTHTQYKSGFFRACSCYTLLLMFSLVIRDMLVRCLQKFANLMRHGYCVDLGGAMLFVPTSPCSSCHIKHSPTCTCCQSCTQICYAFALTEGCACCSGTWDFTFKASDTQ